MKLTKKEALQREFYFKLTDIDNGDTICRSDDLNDIKKAAYSYDDECDGEWLPRCVKYEVREFDGKTKGFAIAEFNPFTKKLLFKYN